MFIAYFFGGSFKGDPEFRDAKNIPYSGID
jgi:hypothetical protein